jgi:predicted DNA-binding transcriptional regulator YafY
MDSTILTAIRDRMLLEFSYDGWHRVVEPHTYGVNRKKHEVLSAWQLSGKPGNEPDWRLFEIKRIENLRIGNKSFSGARDGYRRDDKRMAVTYAQL